MLQIYLLGRFLLLADDRPVLTASPARLPELIAYLVLHPQLPHPRRDLAFLLWPDTTEAQAQANLRKLLHQLRNDLPDADRFVRIDKDTVQWRAGAPYTLDVAELERALARVGEAEAIRDVATLRAALQQAVNLYQGELLPGWVATWILPLRERLRRTFFASLERLMLLLERHRDYSAAIEACHRMLEEDPLHEASYRYLMRLYEAAGDRAGALHAFHTCVGVLQRELGAGPSPAIRAAYARLLAGVAPGEAPPPPPDPAGAAALVNRRLEWAQLQAAWSDAAAGRPGLVLLVGEGGIGKTRLAEELLDWAARQGIATAAARCYLAERGMAYAPVIAWLRARPLPPLAPAWRQELARLLPELADETPRPTVAPSAAGQQLLFEALARALLALQPRLCFVDDLQWCDCETLEWLHFLLHFERHARLLVVATVRPEDVAEEQGLEQLLASLSRQGRLRELVLEPLDAAETAQLATAVAAGPLDPAETARLYRESEGNPLLVVEMVRAGREPAGPRRPWGLGASPAESGLPRPVQALLGARLAQLSPLAREVVGLAAVVGRQFTFAVLARASLLEEESLVRALDELWRRRIICEQSDEAYDFSHDKLREVAYAGLGPARRRMLHRRVAEALAEVHAAALGAVSGEVAAHYQRAGFPADALTYYRRAGAEALKVYAPAEAIFAFEQALSLLPAAAHSAPSEDWGGVTRELHEALAYSLALAGRAEEARAAYAEALPAAQQDEAQERARRHGVPGQPRGA